MAEALAGGILRSGIAQPSSIILSNRRPERRQYFSQRYGFKVTGDNAEAVKSCGTVFISVKPQVVPPVLKEISPSLDPGQLVISIAAGVTLNFLESRLPGIPVIRSMPNTPAMIGAGATVITPGALVGQPMTEWAARLFRGAGTCLVLPEQLMDAVTGLSGSGPAYIFHMAEALTEAGASLGIPRQQALELAKQTILGAARMMTETEDGPERLREKVTSPGGTTEAALRSMDQAGFVRTIVEAVAAAARRSEELGKG